MLIPNRQAILCLTLMLLPWLAQAKEPTILKVGGYHYQPYVNSEHDGTDITPQLIELINRQQSDYQLIFTPIPAKRRYQYLSEGKIDLIMFEEPRWGWSGYDVRFSNPLRVAGQPYRDSDRFIARKNSAQSPDYFDTLENKKIVLTRGYHYRFADFNADEALLKERFDVLIVAQPETVIQMILGGRGDVGVVSYSLVRSYLAEHPEAAEILALSERVDHFHDLRLVVATQSRVSTDTLDQLLEQLAQNGDLDALFSQHHLIE